MWGLLSVSTHSRCEIHTGNGQTPTGEPLGQIWGDDPALGLLPVFWKAQDLLSLSGVGADGKEQPASRSGHGCLQRAGTGWGQGRVRRSRSEVQSGPERAMQRGQPMSISADSREAPRTWQGAGWALSLQPRPRRRGFLPL